MDRYLDLLSEKFLTAEDVITGIINLEATLQPPKGTELLLNDMHGEFPAFDHILRIGLGNLKEKIKDLPSEQMTETEISQFIIFTTYPEYASTTGWHEKQDKSQLIHRLIDLLRLTTVKYARLKIRKGLPKEYSYITEEFLYTDDRANGKKDYVKEIIG